MKLNIKIRSLLIVALFALLFQSPVFGQELALRAKMPLADQSMQNLDGGSATLSGLKGTKGTVVVFWSNECQWSSKVEERLASLNRGYSGKGMSFILVNSNDAGAFPKESAAEAKKRGYNAHYLVDTGSRLARAFGAERAPHVFLFDGNLNLVYSGSVDDSPGDPGNVKATYLQDALDALVRGSAVANPQTKAFGCKLKLAGE